MTPRTKPQDDPDTLPPAPADDSPKYTWAQLDAVLPEPSEADRAAFDITMPAAQLQARGAQIASSRLLTDTQRWLGQLVDFERSVSNPGAVVLGYQPGLSRVLASYARALRTLTSDQKLSASELKLRRGSAEKQLRRVVSDTRLRYETVLASLHGATRNDPALHDRVAAMPSRPGQTALAGQLQVLARLLEQALLSGPAMQVRLSARGLSRVHVDDLRTFADDLTAALDLTRGGTPTQASVQSQIDQIDGAIVTLMEDLMALFPRGRRDGVPVLQPLASRTFFTTARYRRAPSAPAA